MSILARLGIISSLAVGLALTLYTSLSAFPKSSACGKLTPFVATATFDTGAMGTPRNCVASAFTSVRSRLSLALAAVSAGVDECLSPREANISRCVGLDAPCEGGASG